MSFSNSYQGVLNVNTTSTGTTAVTTEETLASYSLPANALQLNGQHLKVRAWGTTGANGNNKTVKLTFGSTTLISSGALAANNKDWYLEAVVVRKSGTAQTAVANGQANGAIIASDVTSPAETLSGAVTVAMKGTNGTAAADDIKLEGFMVEMGLNA